MSLATSGGGMGGGGGGGGLVMGHQAGGQVGQAPGAPPPPGAEHGDTGHGPPPPSAGLLGADTMDKLQMISLKNVRNTSHLPLVAVDLCTSEPHIAYYPPKAEDPSESVPPKLIGKMKATVNFKKDSEASQKSLRKYLSNKASYFSLQADSLSKTDSNAVVLERPQEWLGLRRVEDAPEFIRERSKQLSAKQGLEDGAVGVAVTNGTLDGSKPKNDDFDRVVYQVRLAGSKKHLAVLPEEACQLMLHQAQLHVAAKVAPKDLKDETAVLCYPLAVALPAWMMHDAAVEAVLEATGNTGVVFQRSVCALAGALILSPDGKPNALLERLQKVRAALAKDYSRRKVEDPGAVFEEECLLLMLGMTDECFECTAIQVSNVQQELTTCLFGDFKVLANVSFQDEKPVDVMSKALRDLQEALDLVAPEADGPAGIVTYGTPAEQDKIRKQWDTSLKSDLKEWTKVPVFPSKSDCVATGTALLGAVAHGRQLVLDDSKGDRVKAVMGLRVQNVAPVAVGMRVNYHGGDDDKWTDVRTIFDFDRRLPAGPYPIEFLASEGVVHRQAHQNGGRPSAENMDEEAFLKASKEKEASKHIPEREEAALGLKVQLLQKWARNAEWKPVGDPIEPLVKKEPPADISVDDLDEDDEDGWKRIGCESATLEISLGIHGMITTSLSGDRESVVQATKTARASAIRYYIGILVAILFFGGFLARSYWEEWSFNRDTDKLLAYYKHVLPGSISDGDRRNAMHIVWRYRHKKKALWHKLDKKYGVAVREVWEWDDYEHDSSKEHDETVDLDDDEEVVEEEKKEDNDSGTDSGGAGDEEEL